MNFMKTQLNLNLTYRFASSLFFMHFPSVVGIRNIACLRPVTPRLYLNVLELEVWFPFVARL